MKLHARVRTLSGMWAPEDSVRLLVLDEHPTVRRFLEHVARPRLDIVVETVGTPGALLDVAMSHRGEIDLVVCDSCAERLTHGSMSLAAANAVARFGLRVVIVTDQAFLGYVVPGVRVMQRPISLSSLVTFARAHR